MLYVVLALGLCAVIIFSIKRRPDVAVSIVTIKGIASFLFILTGLIAMTENAVLPKYMGALTIAGACLGLIGDIVLDLKFVYPDDGNKYLKIGFMSFLFGHLFYSASLITAYGINKTNILFGAVGFAVCFIGVFIAERILPVDMGRFRLITAIYIGVVGIAVGLAVSYSMVEHSVHTRMFVIAMIAFLISDFLLSGTYFGITEKDRKNQLAITLNHLTYFIAQYLIVLSLAFYKG
ncbi:MAG: hypothetical protein J6D06_09615 [Clostridia bacterium]|nr:hypothetical protein [Clostridia bacterium]